MPKSGSQLARHPCTRLLRTDPRRLLLIRTCSVARFLLRLPDELAQAPKARRRRLIGMIPSPARERDFADIQIAPGVDGNTVRRLERIHGRPKLRVIDAPDQRTVVSQNAEAGPDVRGVLVDGHARTEFTDITDGALAAGHA